MLLGFEVCSLQSTVKVPFYFQTEIASLRSPISEFRMDQIVFVIDLESFLSESADEDVESLVERGLLHLKEAALKLLTYGRVFERGGDISSFGFRFFLYDI